MTDASSDPTPWRLAAAGCGAYSTSGHAGTPRGCQGAVTHAGLILREHPVQAWLAFSCSMHTDDPIAARPLLDRDRAVLADWRARERRALDGQGWDRLGRWGGCCEPSHSARPTKDGDLATGLNCRRRPCRQRFSETGADLTGTITTSTSLAGSRPRPHPQPADRPSHTTTTTTTIVGNGSDAVIGKINAGQQHVACWPAYQSR